MLPLGLKSGNNSGIVTIADDRLQAIELKTDRLFLRSPFAKDTLECLAQEMHQTKNKGKSTSRRADVIFPAHMTRVLNCRPYACHHRTRERRGRSRSPSCRVGVQKNSKGWALLFLTWAFLSIWQIPNSLGKVFSGVVWRWWRETANPWWGNGGGGSCPSFCYWDFRCCPRNRDRLGFGFVHGFVRLVSSSPLFLFKTFSSSSSLTLFNEEDLGEGISSASIYRSSCSNSSATCRCSNYCCC